MRTNFLREYGLSVMLGVLFTAALTAVLLVLLLARFSIGRRRHAVSP